MEQDKSWFRLDWFILGTALALGMTGILVIAGATHGNEAKSTLWLKQAFWLFVGLSMALGCTFLNYRRLLRWAPYLFIGSLILLLVALSSAPIKGARSWIQIPNVPFRLQPSEFAKVALILVLARYLGKWQGKVDGFKPILTTFFLAGLPTALVVLQPDLGTAIIYLPICVSMLFAGGLHPAYFLLLVSPFLGFFSLFDSAAFLCLWLVSVGVVLMWAVWSRVSWGMLVLGLLMNVFSYVAVGTLGTEVWERAPSHAKSRIIVWLDPDFEPRGAGWNVRQSKIALGSGGFWGHGWGQGTQSKLEFLPELQHDFVFAVLGEQWGFFGCAILLTLFTLLFARCAYIASSSADTEGLLICVGVVAMFATHVIVNIGMSTGLLPVTGLPLTFISYGGAFMMTNLIAVGLICSVSFRRNTRIE